VREKKPLSDVGCDPGYPSVREAMSRREFLNELLLGGVALGGMALGLPGSALAKTGPRPKPKPKRVDLPVTTYVYGGCNYKVVGVTAWTTSTALVAFVKKRSEAAGIDAAVRKVLKAHTCADIKDRKRAARLEKRIGKALSAHFKKRTRRKVAAPKIRMKLRPISWGRTPGFVSKPSFP